MTLKEATNLIESLLAETTKKSEIKIYEKFLHITTQLKKREFSNDELQSIETELEKLRLESNPENNKNFFKKGLSKFETYLKDTFSLTSSNHYTNLCGGLGLSFGILFGNIFLSNFERSFGISLGMIIGMVIGIAIGKSLDNKAMIEGRIL
jgi:hypothetical protein